MQQDGSLSLQMTNVRWFSHEPHAPLVASVVRWVDGRVGVRVVAGSAVARAGIGRRLVRWLRLTGFSGGGGHRGLPPRFMTLIVSIGAEIDVVAQRP